MSDRERVEALAKVLEVRIDKTPTCWLWTGTLNQGGYGVVTIDKKHRMAHRVSYELTKGEIAEGLVLDHLCRVRNCVNPDHLEPVTNRTNILRGIGLSAIAARRDHCAKGHRYTPGSWYLKTNGRGATFRSCRECRNADKRMRRAAEKRARMAVKFATKCPTCGVAVGIECVSVASGKRLGKPHRRRSS